MSNVETGSQEIGIFSYEIVRLYPSMSLNNEKICHKLLKIEKHAVCEKTARLSTDWELSDLNSAFYKVLVPVTIFQFPDMRNENRLFYQIFQPS